jgi:hypothetical protein
MNRVIKVEREIFIAASPETVFGFFIEPGVSPERRRRPPQTIGASSSSHRVAAGGISADPRRYPADWGRG